MDKKEQLTFLKAEAKKLEKAIFLAEKTFLPRLELDRKILEEMNAEIIKLEAAENEEKASD